MPTPTNITIDTAMLLDYGDTTIDVSGLGAPQETWYKYLGKSGEVILGVWAHVLQASNFNPLIRAYIGPTTAPDNFMSTGNNRPIEVPIISGEYIYFKVTNTGVGVPDAPLVMKLRQAPNGVLSPEGSLVIPDTSVAYGTTTWPWVVINATTGEILGYRTGPAGESGVMVASGVSAFEDSDANNIKTFSPTLVQTGTTSLDLNGNGQISTNYVDKFYIGRNVVAANATITKTGLTGAVLTTWTLPAIGLVGLAISPDETIAYYTQNQTANQPVKRYDLVGSAAMSDLAAGISGSTFVRDLVTLGDGSVLVTYRPSSGAMFIKRYSAAGATLNTYTFSVPATKTIQHAIRGIDSGTFWVWEQDGNTHYLSLIRASDGVVLAGPLTVPVTVDGEIQQTPSDSMSFFGASWSCPTVVARTSLVIPPISETPVGPPPVVIPPSTETPTDCCVKPVGPQEPPPPAEPPPEVPPFEEECGFGGLMGDGNLVTFAEDWRVA